jgi:hypothetical protein
MNKYICIGIFLLINIAVFANDSRVTLGRSVEVIDNENTNIIMLEEEIIITLYKSYYEVTVTFDFYNDGPAEDVLLGFPVSATSPGTPPKENEMAQMIAFESYINEDLLTEYTIKEESSTDENGYYKTITRWYIREITFPENSHTYSKVIYKTPYNELGFETAAGYIYGTGRNWKDSIGTMNVIINHGDDIIIDSVSFGLDKSYDSFIWEADGTYKYIMKDIEPDEKNRITIMIRSYDLDSEYEGQFGESWDGEWIWDRSLLYDNFTDIKLFTKNQIRLFIDFFYAMHGYDFKEPLLKEYFQNMPPSWHNKYMNYKVNTGFSEDSFNEFERKNIDYLLHLESMIPFEDNPLAFDNFLELLISSRKIIKTTIIPETIVVIATINIIIIVIVVLCFFVVKKKNR